MRCDFLLSESTPLFLYCAQKCLTFHIRICAPPTATASDYKFSWYKQAEHLCLGIDVISIVNVLLLYTTGLFHLPTSFSDRKGGITTCLPSTGGTACCHGESHLFLAHHTHARFLQKPASPDSQDKLLESGSYMSASSSQGSKAPPGVSPGALNDQRKAMKAPQ